MPQLAGPKDHYGTLDLFIGGDWVKSGSTTADENTDPTTGAVISETPLATEAEARAAVEAAQRGFEKRRQVGVRERGRKLFDLRHRLEESYDVLCRVLTQDHGRTLDESEGSVRRVIENVESACSALYAMPKLNEYVDQLTAGIDGWMTYEPRGVFLIITPGNIPMHAWSSFVPYALAAGCSVVVSPSRQDPVAAEYICRVTQDLGLPEGTINLVHGGRHINEFILRQPEVMGVGFIGSTAVGQSLFRLCGELGKDSSLNGNGKNCVVIMPDADLDQAADLLLRACYGMGGQRCLGSDTVVVIGDVYDAFKEKFAAASRSMTLGSGLDRSVDLGPMCTANGKTSVLDWIDRSLGDGCKIVVDGRSATVAGMEGGYWLAPTLLEGAEPGMPTTRDEAFGPVAALMRMDSLDEVIRWHNDSNNDQGHSACIMTASGSNARKFIREIDTGNVGVNVAVPQPYAFFPLGSKKQSFLGTSKSRYASMRMFLDEKTVTTRW